jgi:hypothetical protein
VLRIRWIVCKPPNLQRLPDWISGANISAVSRRSPLPLRIGSERDRITGAPGRRPHRSLYLFFFEHLGGDFGRNYSQLFQLKRLSAEKTGDLLLD